MTLELEVGSIRIAGSARAQDRIGGERSEGRLTNHDVKASILAEESVWRAIR